MSIKDTETYLGGAGIAFLGLIFIASTSNISYIYICGLLTMFSILCLLMVRINQQRIERRIRNRNPFGTTYNGDPIQPGSMLRKRTHYHIYTAQGKLAPGYNHMTIECSADGNEDTAQRAAVQESLIKGYKLIKVR